MLRRRRVALAGGVLLWSLALTVTLLRLTGEDDALDPFAAPAGPDRADPGEAEAAAVVEEFDLAGSVIHFALREEEAAAFAGDGLAGGDSIADLWFEIDEEARPVRMAVRISDRDGVLKRAVYSDGWQQTVALLEETRAGTAPHQDCIERGPGSPELIRALLPRLMGEAELELEGFTEAPGTIQRTRPTTEADERAGEPERTLTLPAPDEVTQYQRPRPDAPGRIVVVTDPESRIVIAQAVVASDTDGAEVLYWQAMGDLHVHERGAADALFDAQDAIDACEELTP